MRSNFSKPSLYFQPFFDLNQGSADCKIDNFVAIKSFRLKIRPSTAVATLHCLIKILLILLIGSLSNCVSSIGRVFRSVVDTHFDYPESKRWISTTVQAILVILSRVDASFNRKSAATRFAVLFCFLVEL